jgi:superfamily II DNA or RNA helicase/very-short-patch-repair endonuclease
MAALRKRCDSQLEKRWLDCVDELMLRPPSDAQYLIESYYTKPDFYYREHNAAIYIDGPPHDNPEIMKEDDGINRALMERGYIVIRFHHSENWTDIFRRHPIYLELRANERNYPIPTWNSDSCRGREWVIFPESSEDLLIARPVGGLDEEITGILPSIEPVESSSFPFPTRDDIGDFSSGRLLRDAARLSTRAAAGPFRSFGRIAAEPRPYQLVPLMMALKLDPVRLLIADDVGIGKTVETAIIARELLDRGEIQRIAVLCPPQLAEQWQRELSEKFHIDAELILSSTIQRLERDLPVGISVFDRHRFTVVSTDFIKTSRRAEDFILKCPEFVIVDEAHGCTLAGGVGRGRQERFDLLRRVAEDKSRHLVLVTATPHSGNEDAFRSLLSLLDPEFANLPADLDRAEREGIRRKLARHLVQRRRKDIDHYLGTDTSFPKRYDKIPEPTYSFSEKYRELFEDILAFARGLVSESDGGDRRRRVRYWSALALLRCVSSSPAAAAATLRSRAAVDQAADEEVDEVGRRTVLDQDDSDAVLALDLSPGADNESADDAMRRKLLEFARRAEAIPVEADHKLQGAIREIKELIKDGFHPVIFCRFVDTADYVAAKLRDALPAKVAVESVTGLLPPAEREDRIAKLVAESGQYVLVCTDCLAEGVNLQQHFNAVLHYDLAWNPTRHEQREGVWIGLDRNGRRSESLLTMGKTIPLMASSWMFSSASTKASKAIWALPSLFRIQRTDRGSSI